MTLDLFLKIGGAIAALSTVSVAAWTAGDHFGFRPALKIEVVQLEQQLNTVSQSVLLNRFQFLDSVRQKRPLTFDESQERCRIAQALGYIHIDGC